ncbi:MAG TPA: fibronectin type III domain-containing protein, partial [Planctomycetaceae bacterium]|nr:fibronectin type III domain-containing protein [Planctomycetaceae bacterium]
GLAAWGDSDGDRDLDILQVGRVGGLSSVKAYRNNAVTAKTAPAAPTGLTAAASSPTSLTFSWTAAVDSKTLSEGLSYNLRIGTTPGGSDVVSTMADATNGLRRVAGAGPIQRTNFTLQNVTPGATYYWSVQAIDPTFSGSAFAAEQTASTNTSPTIGGAVANQPVADNSTLAPFATMTIVDPDNQNLLAKVTILNGGVRGDFNPATTVGWTRTTAGNDIVYSRYYSPAPNIGATVQAAIRAFVFQPRMNAIKPNTTELTDFVVFINDGFASATNSTTRVVTTSVNDVPTIAGANPSVAVNDNATVNPFSTLTVTDADQQEMLATVTIFNGVVRGDFTNATSAGWTTRSVIGNDITYKRYFSPGLNIGTTAQAAFRALTFQPRSNAIAPGTTELTDFLVAVSDGVASPPVNTATRVTTTSVNNAPTIGGAASNQTMNDNQTLVVFSTMTVNDPDAQDHFVRITIDNGVNRGDFTSDSRTGWTRRVIGSDLEYTRYFNPAANIGATVQAAIRALLFQPRNNVPVGTNETTAFTVFITDGLSNVTNHQTAVVTTGVAPRATEPVTVTPQLSTDLEVTTVIVPRGNKARWLSMRP